MPYVFNLVSKTLAPMPSHPGADPMEFISKDAIVVSNEQAHLIGKATPDELAKMTTQILGKRLMRDQSMPMEHRKILEAGMKALGIDDLSVANKAKTANKAETAENAETSAPEEIAYRFGWITAEQLLHSAELYGKSPYGQHLVRVAEDRVKHLK